MTKSQFFQLCTTKQSHTHDAEWKVLFMANINVAHTIANSVHIVGHTKIAAHKFIKLQTCALCNVCARVYLPLSVCVCVCIIMHAHTHTEANASWNIGKMRSNLNNRPSTALISFVMKSPWIDMLQCIIIHLTRIIRNYLDDHHRCVLLYGWVQWKTISIRNHLFVCVYDIQLRDGMI